MLNELSLFTVQVYIDPQNGWYSAQIHIGSEAESSIDQVDRQSTIMLLFRGWTVPVTFQWLAIYPPSSADSWLREVKRGSAVNLNLIKFREPAGESLSAVDSL